jgi:4-amino-4-deoxy-L-arabinose transferase-like glycosyltransferase
MTTQVARGAVLFVAASLRLWRLDQNGYDNEYYAAAVRSMATSWHAFFYNSFDPTGFVSVDKPPVALWIQATAVKLVGFHELTVLVPQVLEGVAAVAVLDYLVRRRIGAWAGLFAALVLAVMPVSIATDRSNNTESCLVLILLLAACALLRAAERGSRPLFMLSMALIGLGFNVKMLAAFVVLPAFAVVYGLGAPVSWRRRAVDLAIGAVVTSSISTISFSWLRRWRLWPASAR